MESLTNGVGTGRWIEVTKDCYIWAYVPGRTLDSLTEGLVLTKEEKEEEFTSGDLGKVMREES